MYMYIATDKPAHTYACMCTAHMYIVHVCLYTLKPNSSFLCIL